MDGEAPGEVHQGERRVGQADQPGQRPPAGTDNHAGPGQLGRQDDGARFVLDYKIR